MDGRRLQCAIDVVSFCEKRQMEEHPTYPNAKLPTFSIWLNLMMWIEVQCGITKHHKNPLPTFSSLNIP
jgi:hypothetical protein